MKKDLKHLKMIRDKILCNLEFLGLEVDNIVNKEKKNAKPSQKLQTDITAQDIFVPTEQEQAVNILINLHDSEHQVT